jgi:peptidoglycan/xylan/chitin deacetylase (PgdA/CDA1 family)
MSDFPLGEPQRSARRGGSKPVFGRYTLAIWIAVAVLALATVVAHLADRGGRTDNTEPERRPAAAAPATPTAVPATPTPTPVPPATLTAEQLDRFKPNELGQVMVLMYHYLTYDDGEYSRTPEKFREDLEWLHAHDFYVIPIRDYINNDIKAPAGKRPVVLTFDDGPVSQFSFITDASGKRTVDPKSAIGILEDLFAKYPDFGRGGLFSILPLAPFSWPEADDQQPYVAEKLQWLVEHGYEIGDHTVDHVNLRGISDEEIKAELADAVEMTRQYVPSASVEVISVPFGVYPKGGDVTLFEGFDYKGKHYAFSGALMVGANPAPSPIDKEFDPYWIPRIRADDTELGKWFQFVEDNPGILYVSDGNPATLTVPNKLAPSLVGQLNDTNLRGKTIVRY